jgi:plasmid stabilization system protein ParE
VSGYDYVLSAAAAHAVLGSPKRLRKEILTELERLAREPFSVPDLEETGPSGRKYAIRVRERIVLTYWVDHAVKEVRVLRVEIC